MYNPRTEIKIEKYDQLQTDSARLDFLVLLASLAPSSHNTQPWLFEIRDKTITVKANFDRKLPYSDENNRQLFLSIGAAIQNLLHGSDSLGLKYDAEYNFDFDKNTIFTIYYQSLASSSIDQKAFDNLVNRKTNRLPLEDRRIDQSILDEMAAECLEGIVSTFVSQENQKQSIRDIVSKSVKEAFADKKFTTELSAWVKPSSVKYRDGMPGYTIGVPKLISYLLPFAIRNFNLQNFQAKMHEEWLKNAPVYGVISTVEDNESAWVKAGMSFEKIALKAEGLGLRIGIMGAPIEIGDNYKLVKQALGISTRPQMFFRIGYGPDMPHFSPRIDLDKVIVRV
ncbi:nitroreductase family protein [bacterium]|nr:MAG: nitroreductase family protein [bacterium]